MAFALALASAVSLGLSRFCYALLLPPMRADLGWSYLTAGAMNTVNAAGYLVGALLTPAVLRRCAARPVLVAAGLASAGLLCAHGLVTDDLALYALRAATGVASAAMFICGALLAARLAVDPATHAGAAPTGASAGLVLGVYYGGTGLGIVASALIVPPLSARDGPHAWQAAWLVLGAAALVATAVAGWGTRRGTAARAAPAAAQRVRWVPMAWSLCAYALFGLGYIGYMTFVVTLLREQHLDPPWITAFYGLLGLAVVASSWVWAGLLQRQRGGAAMAVLNAVLALATALPVLSVQPLAIAASGLLFGGVFLSVVASTTAFVRHNLPSQAWSSGIGAYTTVFATGQIVGPALVGWIADGGGGLRAGLACSAGLLALAAALASRQRPLAQRGA